MSDGSGSVSYQYNQLSQLTSETRQFSYPGPAGSYTLSYEYNLAGELKKITDPTNAAIDYSYDALGRTIGVTGSSFGGVTQYATNIKYRAWGAVKTASYGNSHTVSAAYNARLQPTHFEIPGVMAKDYQYQADGRIRYSADLLDSRFDRSYSYDHAGRIKEAFSGPLARGQADTNDRPYKEYHQYDAMDHLVGRVGSRHWSQALPNAGVTDSFVNNRNPNWEYDADGRLTDGSDIQSTFDAAGRAVTVVSNAGNQTQTRLYDGDGRQSRMVDAVTEDDGFGNMITTTTTRYSVSSTVVGKVITELDETGQKTRSLVYNGGQVLAWQQKWGSFEQVSWEYRDVSDASYRMATANGAIDEERAAEMDPLGTNAGATTPYTQSSHQHWPGEDGIYPGFADLSNQDCQWNGMPFPCEAVNRFIQNGAAATQNVFFSGGVWHHRFPEPIVPLGLGLVSVWEPSPNGPHNDTGQVNYYLLPQNSTFTDAVTATRQILQGNNPCSEFFGGAGLEALNAIENAVTAAGNSAFQSMGGDSRTGIRMRVPNLVSPSEAPITTTAQYAAISPTSITINTNGPFVRSVSGGSGTLPRFGGYNPGSLQSRVLQLLHETGHLVVTNVNSTMMGIRVGNQTRFYQMSRLTTLLPPDGRDGRDTALSEQNTRRVLEACRKQIEALRR